MYGIPVWLEHAVLGGVDLISIDPQLALNRSLRAVGKGWGDGMKRSCDGFKLRSKRMQPHHNLPLHAGGGQKMRPAEVRR